MPANVIKTPKDEQEWGQAKDAAEKQGKKGNYAYVMGVFEHLKQRTGSKKPKSSKALQAAAAKKLQDLGEK